MLPVGFIQTAQASQSQTLAQPSSKIKIRNVPNSIFDYTNSNFPLTSGGTVFNQPESEYHFPDSRDDGFSFCSFDDNNHVDRNKPPYPPINEKKPPLPANKRKKLSQYNGDRLHWHEWFAQFVSAVDSARLSDDVKLTCLKTLLTGKNKNAIAEFAYSSV